MAARSRALMVMQFRHGPQVFVNDTATAVALIREIQLGSSASDVEEMHVQPQAACDVVDGIHSHGARRGPPRQYDRASLLRYAPPGLRVKNTFVHVDTDGETSTTSIGASSAPPSLGIDSSKRSFYIGECTTDSASQTEVVTDVAHGINQDAFCQSKVDKKESYTMSDDLLVQKADVEVQTVDTCEFLNLNFEDGTAVTSYDTCIGSAPRTAFTDVYVGQTVHLAPEHVQGGSRPTKVDVVHNGETKKCIVTKEDILKIISVNE